jgi:hypothetical protein
VRVRDETVVSAPYSNHTETTKIVRGSDLQASDKRPMMILDRRLRLYWFDLFEKHCFTRDAKANHFGHHFGSVPTKISDTDAKSIGKVMDICKHDA